VLQPIAELARSGRSREIVLTRSASVWQDPLDVKALGIDLMSISGTSLRANRHWCSIHRESPSVPEPLFWGGRQERGLRSGTVAPHLCVAFGEACAIASKELTADAQHALACAPDLGDYPGSPADVR